MLIVQKIEEKEKEDESYSEESESDDEDESVESESSEEEEVGKKDTIEEIKNRRIVKATNKKIPDSSPLIRK